MLKIEDLHVNVEDKKILQGLNLEIKQGEIPVSYTHLTLPTNREV